MNLEINLSGARRNSRSSFIARVTAVPMGATASLPRSWRAKRTPERAWKRPLEKRARGLDAKADRVHCQRNVDLGRIVSSRDQPRISARGWCAFHHGDSSSVVPAASGTRTSRTSEGHRRRLGKSQLHRRRDDLITRVNAAADREISSDVCTAARGQARSRYRTARGDRRWIEGRGGQRARDIQIAIDLHASLEQACQAARVWGKDRPVNADTASNGHTADANATARIV